MDKYEKLRDDLRIAIEKAVEVAKSTKDDGTCNFDSCMLRLPRWNEQKVLNAFELADGMAIVYDWFGKKHYRVFNPIFAQGYRNTVQAETITETLRGMGYEAYCYYQCD